MEYKDFFLHLQQKPDIEELAERVSRKHGVSVVRVLSEVDLLKEWQKAGSEEAPQELLDRIKDSPDAPSVGDEVEINFDEASRGFLTPRQKEANGKAGTVTARNEFKTGSQLARYTVEIKKDGEVHRVKNLTPGEVASKQ